MRDKKCNCNHKSIMYRLFAKKRLIECSKRKKWIDFGLRSYTFFSKVYFLLPYPVRFHKKTLCKKTLTPHLQKNTESITPKQYFKNSILVHTRIKFQVSLLKWLYYLEQNKFTWIFLKLFFQFDPFFDCNILSVPKPDEEDETTRKQKDKQNEMSPRNDPEHPEQVITGQIKTFLFNLYNYR